jgi:molybdate transport system substrate-binding protein
MSNSTMKKMALGLSTAMAVIWSAPANAQNTLEIAPPPVFAKPALDFSGAFGAWYNLHNTVDYSSGLSVDSDSDIESDIINGNIFIDLFFSATPEIPERLARHHPKLVVGRPFPVAIDSLELYSPSVDISAGLPFPLTTKFAIPDPTQDNYGVAAAHILAQLPWRIPAS